LFEDIEIKDGVQMVSQSQY